MKNFWLQADFAGFLWTEELGESRVCVGLLDFVGFL
jgi:hypothetical protein